MNSHDTIAAVATAVASGCGSVAIVRISGPRAEAIGRTLFRASGSPIWQSHRIHYGHVVDPDTGERVDEVLLLWMQAPRSFTREDVVEIHGHGGLVAVRRVMDLVLAAGARRALPGEFSQRAFLNGRLDLTRAEAVAELIAARSQRAARLAMAGLDGGLQRRITALRNRLLDQLAELEARVDFEEDLPPLDADAVVAELGAVGEALAAMVAEARQGELLREGLRVAIVGRPNVGKSSLLNRLSERDRAIVTELPGTTRDLLESELVLEGVPLILVDTAGIRSTSDRVEQLGIARSHQALASADAVLLLYDRTAGWTQEDQALREQIPPGVPLLVVANKADVVPVGGPESTPTAGTDGEHGSAADAVVISALTGAGVPDLARRLLAVCGAPDSDGLEVALNRRQRDLAAEAQAALGRALETAAAGLPWDFWTIDLRAAIRSLGTITGEEVSEAVLDRVFERFCIGK